MLSDFSRDKIRQAVRLTNNDMEKSLQLLLDGGLQDGDDDFPPPAVASAQHSYTPGTRKFKDTILFIHIISSPNFDLINILTTI